ncbi:MAG: helix-turn-helix domain-containing protein [Actinomycetota bacterium]|nr:helix-turn-helix domain-containing protein [Actinomycetota bacterium]
MLDYGERLGQLSAAMADSTRRRIFEYLRESDSPLSARQVAEHFGLHVNAARIHLEKLAGSGLVRVIRRRGDLGGRPAYHYQVDEGGDELHFPPRQYRLLAEILAGAVSRMSSRSRLAVLEEARHRGRMEAAAEASPLLRVRGQDARSLAGAWDEDLGSRGLRRRTRVTEEGCVKTVFLSCPFGELPRTVGELVCDVHAALEEGRIGLAGEWRLNREEGCAFTARPPGGAPRG